MKILLMSAALLATMPILGGCSTLTGAAIGGVGGAGVAAATGNDAKKGAVAGAVAGGVIGTIVD